MEVNHIYNMDCLETMRNLGKRVDIVLTSPPYNTSRVGASDKYNSRYDSFQDFKTDQDYIDWTIKVFESYSNVLKENGVVLYNLSYSSENTHLIWMVVAEIIKRTDFVTADCIIWKKSNALPNNRSKNKLTRITEYIFVFCRKQELKTFNCHKRIVSTIERTGQANYENVFNFMEARNNDDNTPLNKATFSTDICRKLLSLYGQKGFLIYDSFMGTGTTALASLQLGMDFLGSELSKEQCEYAEDRIKKYLSQPKLNEVTELGIPPSNELLGILPTIL